MRLAFAIISSGLLLAVARTACWAAVTVGIYDTNTPAASAWSESAVAGKTGWTLVAEETTDHRFRGDTVLANDRLTLVFRRGGCGAELYADGPRGVVCRAVLAPAGATAGTRCAALAIVENTADRKRWTTVLGFFRYPCWIDRDGQGFLQPLKKPGKFHGPALIYPVNRVAATPLAQFTFVDLVRATLGVGPCEYILDVEGQKKRSEGVATCATRTKLNAIYAANQQRAQRAEVEQALVDVLAFVRHIRDRIDAYAQFGHDLLAYLEQQQKTHPELAGFVTELEKLTRRIDEAVAQRIGAIGTPAYATGLADEFRRTVLDNAGDEALDQCKKITAAFVEIGGNQDELVGECRLAVKILRQRAGLSMATDPRTAAIAQEVRRRTQAMLRHPVSYEAPRH